jgi:hypothetical protein
MFASHSAYLNRTEQRSGKALHLHLGGAGSVRILAALQITLNIFNGFRKSLCQDNAFK